MQAAQQAWTTQVFAKPKLTIQPVGNTTITGLPTYFQAGFPEQGLAPGEETSATVLGQSVTIRPTNVRYTYVFGDGTTYGPTTNAGGPYPTGTLTHTYTKKGKVTVRVDITISGEFRVGQGAWTAIPGSTTVQGTPQQLTVKVVQSRLHH